jgi:hypothetical protein
MAQRQARLIQNARAGKKLPERDELGDLNKTEWELDPDDQPKDPWQNTRFVYLVDPISAEAYTFVTASWGGRQAVNVLPSKSSGCVTGTRARRLSWNFTPSLG